MNTVAHHSTTGRFYLGEAAKQFQIVLRTPFGTVDELWPEDEAPDYSPNLDPEDVLLLIEERLRSYWINTGRDEKLKRIEAIRANAQEIELLWSKQQAIKFQKQAAEAAKQANRYLNRLLESA